MPQPRYRLVDPQTTPYYHYMSRCARRAFLCGKDRFTGKSFGHRKQWILDRVKLLSSVFAIDLCAYAIMSNHFHLVLHLDIENAQSWTEIELTQTAVLFRVIVSKQNVFPRSEFWYPVL